jgi:hypothetical protein
MACTRKVASHRRTHRAEAKKCDVAHDTTIRQWVRWGVKSGAPGGTRTHDL